MYTNWTSLLTRSMELLVGLLTEEKELSFSWFERRLPPASLSASCRFYFVLSQFHVAGQMLHVGPSSKFFLPFRVHQSLSHTAFPLVTWISPSINRTELFIGINLSWYICRSALSLLSTYGRRGGWSRHFCFGCTLFEWHYCILKAYQA